MRLCKTSTQLKMEVSRMFRQEVRVMMRYTIYTGLASFLVQTQVEHLRPKRTFKDHRIRLKIIELPTTMMDLPEGQEWVFEMVNNILIEVLGTIAERERETIHERQAEGIAAAKAKGKKLGRPALIFPANWDEVYSSWKAGQITAKEAMERTGTKRTSFYKLAGMMEK